MTRVTLGFLGLAVLSACATPNEPTVNRSDIDRAFDEANEISALPLTSTNNLPTGAVTYKGQLGADISGDQKGSILGDMTMRIDFADNDIDGRVSNINLIDPDGDPNQRIDGTLQISGSETSGRIDAIASGDITAIDKEGFVADSEMRLTLDGDVYDDFAKGDAIFGSAEGAAEGDLNLDVDGVFFGVAE